MLPHPPLSDPVLAMDPDFEWPNGARLAVSLVVNVEEGAEMSLADGDKAPEPVDELGATPRKPVRVHGNESNYRYGIRRGGPRILALLRRYGVKATFTAAALALERAPELARAIAADGHEVAAHGYRWLPQHRMAEAEERDFIRRARDSIEASTGQRPVGWLSRYLHSDATRRILAEEGFAYHMDDYSDDLPFWDRSTAPPIVVLPYAIDTNDMKMWSDPGLSPRAWADYAIDSFDWLYREAMEEAPRMMSLGVHLRIIGRPGRIGALQRVLAHIQERSRIWVAPRREICKQFITKVPASGSRP